MNNRYFLFSLLFVSFAAAMDEENMLAMEYDTTRPLHIYIVENAVYIGLSKQRCELKEVYGKKKLPLNTIFFQIRYEYNDDFFKERPFFISYDDIKDKKEGESIKLTIAGKERTIVCKKRDGGRDFQNEVTCEIEAFKEYARWLEDGKESLIRANVIEKSKATGDHGENCSPYVK